MSNIKNELGNVYGNLIVIDKAPSKNGKASWLCQCSCGKIISVTGDALRQHKSVSCGQCGIKKQRTATIGKNNRIDITGQKFGKLTALYLTDQITSDNRKLWMCQCECGNKHLVEYSNLVGYKVQSCGCLTSQGEMIIQQLFDNNNIKYKTQYCPNGWKLSSNYKPRFDFAVFNNNNELLFLLEYNGEQHRTYANKGWNTEQNYKATIKRDAEKQQLCIKNNIPCYIIWYDEDIYDSLLKITFNYNLIFNKNIDIINNVNWVKKHSKIKYLKETKEMADTKEIKLTSMSSEVFNYVKNNGGEASIPELESATGRSAKSISANVTDLQKKGFAVRDKRESGEDTITYVVLTDEGKAFNC